MAGPVIMLYGVAIRDLIKSGDLDQMRSMASVSNLLLKNSDIEGDELADLQEANKELMHAINERDQVEVAASDIIAIRDGIVVIDNIKLARRLKLAASSDLEDTFISLITIVIK